MNDLNYNNNILLSDTIRFLRFPLIVGVVLIHSQIAGEWMERVTNTPTFDFPVYSSLTYFFSCIIARISVPLFFFFSGFLFFYKTSFNRSIYFQKLCKRGKTLLIPYLLWNLIAISLTVALHFFLPGMVTEGPESYHTVGDYLQSFWDFKPFHHGTPMNDPLWFIRDLMVVMLASPLVFLLLKYCKLYGLGVLGILWFMGWWTTQPGFSIAALFFFSVGAYFAIHKKNFVEIFKPHLSLALVMYITTAVLQMLLRRFGISSYISKINILFGIVMAISMTSWLIEKGIWKVNLFLTEASFFIYVYHGLIIYRLTSRAFMILPHTDWALSLIYLLCPVIIIGIGLPLFAILKKALPKTTALLMGNRQINRTIIRPKYE